MKHIMYLCLLVSCLVACQSDETEPVSTSAPSVTSDVTYTVLQDLDIAYAQGLAHDEFSEVPFAIPLYLDVYYPDNTSTNRPVFMWIHGGGFTGGKRTRPDIIEMAEYYVARGWVFASIDYRTTEELCDSEEMDTCKGKVAALAQNDPDDVVAFYKGIAPQEWLEFTMAQAPDTVKKLQQSIAQYAAQRDAKAALRWIVANANTYGINTDYITVGGNSAGSVTTIALGISNQDDFRDEISLEDDPTLSSTNLSETYDVKSMVYFWGSNAKLDFHEAVYNLEQYARYDGADPELFMGHGQAEDPQTPYSGALELQDIYASIGVYSELKTLVMPDGSPAGHGAWEGVVDGKGLFEMSFEFLVERQGLELD